jgi:hypothetical protein
MRKHPDFETGILPHMKVVINQIKSYNADGDASKILTNKLRPSLAHLKDQDDDTN